MAAMVHVALSPEAAQKLEAATADPGRPRRPRVEVELHYLEESVTAGTVAETVQRAQRAEVGGDSETVLPVGTPVGGVVALSILDGNGSEAGAHLLTITADSAEYTINVEDVERLLAHEVGPVAPTVTPITRNAILTPIGAVTLVFAQSVLSFAPVNSEMFSESGVMARLGFDSQRSSAIALADAQLPLLAAIDWLPVHVGVDGRFMPTFREVDSLPGWAWWLSGRHQLMGFVADDVSRPSRRTLVLALPVLPAPADPCDPVAAGHSHGADVPRDVTEVEVANNPQIYSEDPGAFCRPFSNPERVLSERAFAVVARVQQPDIGALGSGKTRIQQLLDLEFATTVALEQVTPQVNAAALAANAGTAVAGNAAVRVVSPPSRDALVRGLLSARAPVRARETLERVEDIRSMPRGRTTMSQEHPLQWEDDIAQYQAATVALGHILEFRVRTRSNGYSLGTVASTLTLAPRQTKRIQKISFERLERARRQETTRLQDQVDDAVTRERSYDDTVSSYLDEWARGSAWSTSKAASAGIGFAIPPIVGGAGGGISKSSGGSEQEGGRAIVASEQQRLRDSIRRHGDALRRFESTVVSEVIQEETVTGSTEVLRNPNYGHSLTVIYYQILRHLKVATEFAGARECLFVPFAIKPFNLQRTYRWREAIQACIRSARFAQALRHLRDVATDFQFSDLQPGARAAQRLSWLRGSITLQLGIERPGDVDAKFDTAGWQLLAPLLGTPALGIWTQLAALSDGQRDAQFQRAHAPTAAAKWANRIIIKAGGTDLQADCTLATRYGFNQPVRVDFMVPASRAQMLTRSALTDLTIEAGSALPPRSVANLIGVQLAYGTRNFDRRVDGISGVADMVVPGSGAADKAQAAFPLDAWDYVDEREQLRNSVNELIEHLNEHVEYYHKAIWWNMDRDRLLMLLDGFYVPGTDKVSIASVVDREPVAIIGNSLVYRVGAAFYIGYGKVDTPKALYDVYAGDGPQTDPLLLSLPTDGLYAQTIMDECGALEEHYGGIDWVLDDPDPELGSLDPALLQSRRADSSSTVTPTALPATLINLQNAPDAPAPAGLAGMLGAITNPNAFRDMAGLAATQANAAAAFTTAAGMATQFGSQAAALKLAELAAKSKSTEDAHRKLAAVHKARSNDLISAEQANSHSDRILADMHGDDASQQASDSLDGLARQMLDGGRSGSVTRSDGDGTRVIEIKPAEFQADHGGGAIAQPTIAVNGNVGAASIGRAAIFSFGTFKETNRFKTESFRHGFFDTDVLFNSDPGELLNRDGVGLVEMPGAQSVFSLFRTEPDDEARARAQRQRSLRLWRQLLPAGDSYRNRFKDWIDAALNDNIDCLYLTGHHWSPDNDAFNLSNGVFGSSFRLGGQAGADQFHLGYRSSNDRDDLVFGVTPIRNACKLIFGFGCDVATRDASAAYQSVFGRGANDVPVVCGWNTTVGLPSWSQADRSPNVRYFQFLRTFADANLDPANPPANLLQWLYDNHPLELVRAWGHATRLWIRSAARARGKDGKLYRFQFTGSTIDLIED